MTVYRPTNLHTRYKNKWVQLQKEKCNKG
uniref:Uncharacterized protein n=1 Tax=Arundo donax TaxID=35708 RepID=A0A0A9EA45_ARUDO